MRLASGIAATFLNSTLASSEASKRMLGLRDGSYTSCSTSPLSV